MSQIVPFTFDDANIRVVNRDGEPWFVLADVCAVLEHTNSRVAAQRLDDEDKGVANVYTPGGTQEVTIVNESGLWALVLTSRKPEAKRFKRWITAEVIPQIRKKGGYGRPAPDVMAQLNDPDTLRGLLLNYSAQVKELETQVSKTVAVVEEKQAVIAEQTPKVAALARLSAAEGCVCLRDAAKVLKCREKWLLSWLSQSRWIYRRPGRGNWIAYSEPLTRGYLDHRIHTTTDRDTGDRIEHPQVLITAKGLAHIAVNMERELADTSTSTMRDLPLDSMAVATAQGGAS